MLRCQRIGCNATFSPDNNPEDACQYHPGPPLFHDGAKEWKCCKQRSHDFSLFMDIPGCATGKHTTEKTQISFNSTAKAQPVVLSHSTTISRESCGRCRQGFFCSDHGTQPLPQTTLKTVPSVTNVESNENKLEKPKKVVDVSTEQTCKNCKQVFTEMQNHDTACSYHPGPPVFHDRSRGWACCDVHVKEFDEFLEIPPCSKGWHQGE